jgi:peptide/nickel transport system substrate-binding protein
MGESSTVKYSRLIGRVALMCATAMLLTVACGGGGSGSTPRGTVTIDNVTGQLWPCSFNPFISSNDLASVGLIYEPLVFVNAMNGKETKWLASDYKWSGDNMSLTFTIRQGVKWSDGQDLTADDVVFTFALMKQHPPLDLQAVWSVLSDVKKQGSDQVVMTFQQPAVPYFYYIADQVGIVPGHIWSTVSDPTKYQDAKPVGTGPFVMSQCTPQAITYSRNKSYWQPGKPQVDKVVYPAFTDNDPGNLFLAQGKADWGGQFIPNIDSFYVSKDKANNHYWFPPSNNVYVFPNLTKAPMGNKSFRQALAYAIDRQKVSKDGEYGYEPAANQTGVVTPTFDSWNDFNQAKKYNYRYDATKALQLFGDAGYKKGSDGMLHGPDGKPLTLHIIDVSGFTDWVASVNAMKDNLKQVGIDLQPENLDQNVYQQRLYNGDFELAYGTMPSYGPQPYYELKNLLFSGNTADIGQVAASNYERWRDGQTDKLLNDYAATQDSSKQHQIVNQLQGIMLEQVPAIPVTEGVAWYQYSTKHFDNWPTQSNFYAAPAPFVFPDWEVVLINLQPK